MFLLFSFPLISLFKKKIPINWIVNCMSWSFQVFLSLFFLPWVLFLTFFFLPPSVFLSHVYFLWRLVFCVSDGQWFSSVQVWESPWLLSTISRLEVEKLSLHTRAGPHLVSWGALGAKVKFPWGGRSPTCRWWHLLPPKCAAHQPSVQTSHMLALWSCQPIPRISLHSHTHMPS